MSYIIAFVNYQNSDKTYPTQCFRTDLTVDDEVIVRRKDRKLRNATIRQLRYLNWDCSSRIECKKSESGLDKNGNFIVPTGSPVVSGISTAEIFIKFLRDNGWMPLKPKQKMYRSVLANTNRTQVAYIFVRRNGLDLQLMPISEEGLPKPYSSYMGSFSEGIVVRHALAHTTFNLYEGIIRFSNSFQNNESDLQKYFVSQGATDKRTEELREKALGIRASNSATDTDTEYSIFDIYDAISCDDGEPAYLGDGIWLTLGGGVHDWGR